MGRFFSLSCSLPGLHWACAAALGCTGTQLQPDDPCPCILCLRLLLSLPTSSQLICHCQQDQEMGKAEETAPRCFCSPWGQQPIAIAQLTGKATCAGWNGGGLSLCCVPTLHPQQLASTVLCCWSQPLPRGREKVAAGLQCPHSMSISSSRTNVGSPGIQQQSSSCRLLQWEGGFSQGWVPEFGQPLVWLSFRQMCSVWIWLCQGHRRFILLLTLLLPHDGTDDAKGKCQDVASHFHRNGAIDDEECCIYSKFGLSCCSGSFLHKAHCIPSFPVCRYFLLHEVAVDHPELISRIHFRRVFNFLCFGG